jgi:hypothetical protein
MLVVLAVCALAVGLLVPLSLPAPRVLSQHRAPAAGAPAAGRDTVAAFRGLGAWVDIYDFAPEYQTRGADPVITPATVTAMVADGVHTVFLQTAGDDQRTSGGLVSPELLARFLTQAHRRGLRVVGWYRPTFAGHGSDLAKLTAIARFHRAGQRFDGIAVDIESDPAMPAASVRTHRLVALSQRLRGRVGRNYPLAAITIPPLILSRIDPAQWPGFPWHALAPIYDVWIPMSYWTFRKPGSPNADPRHYTAENITLTRRLLGKPHAAVYALGGVGDHSTPQDYRAFLAGAAASHAVGAGIYDYRSTSRDGMALLAAGVPAAGFPPPAGPLHETG